MLWKKQPPCEIEPSDRARRRRFLAWAAAVPALTGLAARVDGSPSPAPALSGDRDVRAFGALGDGVADDTAAIQAALDSAAAGGGGTVRIAPGRYSTRTLTIDSRVHLVGAGIEATVLTLRAGTDGDLIRSRGFAELSGTNRNVGPYNFSIRALTLDGNRARNARGCGLRLYAFGYLLGDLRIRQCAEAGVCSEWSTEDPEWSADGTATPGDSMEAQVVNLKVHRCGQGGIRFRGPHDSQFVNCVVYDTTTVGIHIEQGERFSAVGCQFVNGHVWGGHAYAWKIEAGFVTLENCVLASGQGRRRCTSMPTTPRLSAAASSASRSRGTSASRSALREAPSSTVRRSMRGCPTSPAAPSSSAVKGDRARSRH